MLSTQLLDMSKYFKSHTPKWNSVHGQHKGSPPENSLLNFCDLILKYEKYKPNDSILDDNVFSPASEKTSDSYSSESDSFHDAGYASGQKNSDDSDESWNLITCFCMKPFKGRPMIECNRCSTWLHMSCVKIRPNHVPDVFICQFCRETKARKRRSSRRRSDEQPEE